MNRISKMNNIDAYLDMITNMDYYKRETYTEDDIWDTAERAAQEYGCTNCKKYPCKFIKDLSVFTRIWAGEIEEVLLGGDGLEPCYDPIDESNEEEVI